MSKLISRLLLSAVLVTSVAVASTPEGAQAVPPQVKLQAVKFLKNAIDTAVNPVNHATYVATRDGKVYQLRPGKSAKLVLDIRWRVRMRGEMGLLGITFHPTQPYMYLVYNSRTKNALRTVEYFVRPDGTIRSGSYRIVIIQSKPDSNHNGGDIAFGPDGYLYQSYGDGGGAGDPKRYAQKLSTLLGKMTRINPRPSGNQPYSVPADNPFVGVNGARPEIWSLGWRNPWRWSFDALTGDMWVGDVGQAKIEEIDMARASDGAGKGKNYGWSGREGSLPYNLDQPQTGLEDPLYEINHDDGVCAITGGFVYRGAAIPALQGAYLFADLCGGKLWAMTLDGSDNPTVTVIASVKAAVDFSEDASGELLVITNGGQIYKIVPMV